VTEPSHAVFLSYASQDAQAAQRICEALRAAGIEVWFDQSELRGGDACNSPKLRPRMATPEPTNTLGCTRNGGMSRKRSNGWNPSTGNANTT
jgi:hypothetical protein